MEKDFRFTLRGKKYSFETFCASNPLLTEEEAEMVINRAIMNGIAEEDKGPHIKKTEQIINDIDDADNATGIRNDERTSEETERNIKNTNALKHPVVNFQFSDIRYAKKFYESALQAIAIPESDVSVDGLTNTVRIKNITDSEVNILTVIYKSQNITKSVTNGTSKIAQTTANIAGYIAKDVAAPIIKTGVRTGLNVAGSLFHSLVKAGADIISTGVDCAKDTAHKISNDESYQKAKGDLKVAGAKIVNKVGNIGGSSGISFG